MKTYIEPERASWAGLCARPSFDDAEIESVVSEIVESVRRGGDKAVIEISERIDGRKMSGLEVTEAEINDAVNAVQESLKQSIHQAYANIEAFHKAQAFKTIDVLTSPGVRCIQKAVPIRNVGIYIPGGTAPLFSTVLMLAIPARIAGCGQVIMSTPRGRDGKIAPAVLYAASLCGVNRIFAIGGAQAVAAMAFGTESVPKVDKIFGPGNRYVAKAKRLVSNAGTAVDMFAGPSEVLVVADESSNPAFVAADLLSQAEHGKDSQVVLVCSGKKVAEAVSEQVDIQLEALPRKDIAEAALQESFAVVLADRTEMIDFANVYAPEHLIISASDPWELADMVTAAGSVFIGAYSPESAGDYASGTNHTLPTSGTAVAASGVNLDSFMHKITYQELSREGLRTLSKTIIEMAEAEGLDAHANAVRVRIDK